MGIFSNLATGSDHITSSKPRVGLDRASAEQLLNAAAKIDPPSSAAYAAADEVTSIPEQTTAATGDTFTLTCTFPVSGLTVTTAAIAYDAADTVIETAIDVAFTAASYPSWTNADISVLDAAAAGLSDGIVTITFDGASVTELPCLVTITPTGWTQDGTITRTTGGSGDREALEALVALNAISGTPHKVGDTATVYTKPASIGQSRPRTNLVRDLGQQVVSDEGNADVWDQLLVLYPGIDK